MLAKFISTIKAEKDRVAAEAIKVRPGEGKDISFEYGYRQGVYAGLERAMQLIEQVVRDPDNQTQIFNPSIRRSECYLKPPCLSLTPHWKKPSLQSIAATNPWVHA